MDNSQLAAVLVERFGPGDAAIHFVRSPGRVNLIGEHTDYNDGYVCPMAIERELRLAFRARADGVVRMTSTQFDDMVRFSLHEPIVPVPYDDPRRKHWGEYVRGVAAELLAAGIPISGMDAVLDADLPRGSGLSSSAAIEIGTSRALLGAAGTELDGVKLALIAQQAEWHFPQVRCGIMDQMIVSNGRAGHAMLLDCRSMQATHLPIDSRDLVVVVVNSKHEHKLSGGEYNERRSQCEAGVEALRAKYPFVVKLRDATIEMLDAVRPAMSDLIYRRCRHVITEIARCEKFGQLLPAKRYDDAGKLMYESHASLAKDFQVSTEHLDALVEIARGVKGVYGSRLTGAGFGGCTVTLAQKRAIDQEHFADVITRQYAKQFGIEPDIIVTAAADGARLL